MEEEFAKLMRMLCALLGLSALAAASRAILSEDRRSLKGFFRGMILAVFAGSIVGLLIQDMGFSTPTQGGIVSLVAFIADDLLLMIINVTRMLRNNPRIIIDYIFRRNSGYSGYRDYQPRNSTDEDRG